MSSPVSTLGAASPPVPGSPFVRRSLALLVLIVVSVVLLWRRPDILANPQFWAEDGNVFFMQAHERGMASVGLPYAGYYHLAARTTAWAATGLPAEYSPHVHAYASWLFLALLVLYIFSDRLLLRLDERAVLALALVCTTSSNEVFFNVANWATLTAPWLMLLSVAREARNRREALFDIALLVIAGLSTPFSICLWLLFAVRLTIRRTRFSAILFAVSLVIAALQLWHMGGRVAEPEAEPLLYRIDDLAYRLGFVFFGEALYRLRLDLTSRVVLLGGFGLAYATAARRAWTSGSHPASVFLLAHVLVVAVSYFVTRTWAETDFVAHTGRHQYLPAVTLVWAMACLRMVPAQWIPVGLAFAAFVFLNPANKRDVWPDLHWREQLARCRVQSGPCQIPIHPLTRPPQVWTVTVTGTP